MGQNKLEKAMISQEIHSIFTKSVKSDVEDHIRSEIADILQNKQLYVKSKEYQKIVDNNIAFLFNGSTIQNSDFLMKKLYVEKAPGQYSPLKKQLSEIAEKEVYGILKDSDIYKNASHKERDLLDKRINAAYVNNFIYAASSLPSSEILDRLSKNPYHQEMGCIKKYRSLLSNIPADITALFPKAREMQRHFILHVGDTNTGKTYDAVQDYMAAERGVFLGPLRLLAMETQEKLNDAGVPCSLLTGEEEDFVKDATHIASTIEMLNTENEYDVCVIDETQMISDRHRGWAWTKAILGVCAKRVHICMSENARDLVIQLIQKCGDTYEVVDHKRNTPLVFDKKDFAFPYSVQEHDALIVFSRQKVLAVAAELRSHGIEASVIYGALPYSVRKNEIHRFINGDTSVIVSTDAIGMGMNLPVERIVFLESSKYDGIENRLLLGPEVKQIAGRAGRRGMYDIGYVNALIDKKYLEEQFNEKYSPLKHARVQLPESLLELDMPLSEIIKQWAVVVNEEIYEKEDTEIMLEKCAFLEYLLKKGYEMTKRMMWRFMTIPFDEKNDVLVELWKTLVIYTLDDIDLDINMESQLYQNEELDTLEMNYKILDLYFSFARALGYNKNEFRKHVMEQKDEVAVKIMKKLEEKELKKKECIYCQRTLPWNYPYKICQKCYGRRYRYSYY